MPLTLRQVDSDTLKVRLLSPLDLAVSKISRFSSQDRGDIAALAKRGLIKAEALKNYVGDLSNLKGAIEIACRIVTDSDKRTHR